MYNHTPIQKQKHTGKHIPTAHLTQTMKLLQMNNIELLDYINNTLSDNIVLEIEENHSCPQCHRKLNPGSSCMSCNPITNDFDEAIVFMSQKSDLYTKGSSASSNETSGDDFTPQYEDLPIYVYNQIVSDIEEHEKVIASHILTNLDQETGLLTRPVIEIAQDSKSLLSEVQSVLDRIQRCDPIGVASPTSIDAMLVQFDFLNKINPLDQTIRTLIESKLEEISKRQYEELSSELGIPTKKIKYFAEYIAKNFNPYPALGYWGNTNTIKPDANIYHQPDAIISLNNLNGESQVMIEVIWPIRGEIQISKSFQEAMASLPPSKTTDLKKDFQEALLFKKCLDQRNNTIVQLMKVIGEIQKEFIEKGDAFLKPITRAKIADMLGVHESTISRAVSSKSVQLPSGKIVPLSNFFDRSLHIRTFIKEIIENETKPLSDAKITRILTENNYDIKRRTVAKYRNMEKIPPAYKRAIAQ